MDQMEVEAIVKSGIMNASFNNSSISNPLKKANAATPDVNIMADTAPSVTISLHPLVILNISEHWTRIRAQTGEMRQVYGALIGKHKGRNIEVMNSFELKVTTEGNELLIDRDYYNRKENQFKQVFSDLDFIGWYTTGEYTTKRELQLHKQITEINECPIMLQLNSLTRKSEQLPIKLYESVIDIINDEATMLFVPLTYTLATEEAERIGVDHVARMSTNELMEKSIVAEHLVAPESAIKMLNTRIKILYKYINAIECKKLTPNHEILRETYALSHRLPVMDGEAFQEEFYTQCNDVVLISCLGSMTKGCNDLHQFINKFNVLHDRQSCGRRMKGMYY